MSDINRRSYYEKIVTYLVTLGMMLTMMPATVLAADTASAPAATEEAAEKMLTKKVPLLRQ